MEAYRSSEEADRLALQEQADEHQGNRELADAWLTCFGGSPGELQDEQEEAAMGPDLGGRPGKMDTLAKKAKTPPINIIFDGPPSHRSGRFVEVEDDQGRSLGIGTWIDRGGGYWALRIEAPGDEPWDVPTSDRGLPT